MSYLDPCYIFCWAIFSVFSLPSDQKRHKISVPIYSEAPHSPPPSHHPNLKVFFSFLFSMNSSRNKLLWLSCLPKITASLRAETPCLSQSIAALRVKFRSRQGWVKTCQVYVLHTWMRVDVGGICPPPAFRSGKH